MPPAFRDTFIEVTGLCNLKCCHCFRREAENINVTPQQVDERLGLVDTQNVIVTGGEPTMNPNLGDIMKVARKHVGDDGNLIIITNGVLSKCEDLLHLGQADVVNVSLDWPGGRHDENRGMAGLCKRVGHVVDALTNGTLPRQPKVNILTTMFRENMDVYTELIHHAWDIGADGIVFDRYVPYNEPPTALSTSELRSALKVIQHESDRHADLDVTVYELFNGMWNGTGIPRWRCKQRAFVNVLGKWSLCPFYPKTFDSPSLATIERQEEPLPTECRDCEFAESCHGGCPASRLVRCKTLDRRDPLCDYSP